MINFFTILIVTPMKTHLTYNKKCTFTIRGLLFKPLIGFSFQLPLFATSRKKAKWMLSAYTSLCRGLEYDVAGFLAFKTVFR